MPDPVEATSDFESRFSKAVKEAWAPHPTNPVIEQFVSDLFKHGKSLLPKWTADEREEKPQVPVIIIQFDGGSKDSSNNRLKSMNEESVRRPVELRNAMEAGQALGLESSSQYPTERLEINRKQIFRYHLPELELLILEGSETKPSLGTAGRQAELPSERKQ